MRIWTQTQQTLSTTSFVIVLSGWREELMGSHCYLPLFSQPEKLKIIRKIVNEIFFFFFSEAYSPVPYRHVLAWPILYFWYDFWIHYEFVWVKWFRRIRMNLTFTNAAVWFVSIIQLFAPVFAPHRYAFGVYVSLECSLFVEMLHCYGSSSPIPRNYVWFMVGTPVFMQLAIASPSSKSCHLCVCLRAMWLFWGPMLLTKTKCSVNLCLCVRLVCGSLSFLIAFWLHFHPIMFVLLCVGIFSVS